MFNGPAIALIDADSFYASCELARRPHLRGKPLMVLGRLGSCILAKTPEAKKMGITTALPFWEAKKLCPQGIYLEGDFRYYTLMSRKLMNILREWSPVTEVYSVDEAFMSLGGLPELYGKPLEGMAEDLRTQVRADLGITVSVGISVNKTLAKMAAEINKPNGTMLVPGAEIAGFLERLPVTDIPGIGHSRGPLLGKYGVRSALDLARLPQIFVTRLLGKTGLLLWRELNGEISFPVSAVPAPPKSIARTSSFDKPTTDLDVVRGMTVYHLERAIEALHRSKLLAGEVSFYLRDKEFHHFSVPHRFEKPTDDFLKLIRAMSGLMAAMPRGRIWRSSGAALTRLAPATGQQLGLFDDPRAAAARDNLNTAKRALNERYGRGAVASGATLWITQKNTRPDDRLFIS